jgi:hypothetical protein
MMATAGMGIASVIHHAIINTALANTLLAIGSRLKGFIKMTNKNNTGPLSSASNDFDGKTCLFMHAEFS